MVKKSAIILVLFVCFVSAFSQNSDSSTIKAISDEIFLNSKAYDNLRYICKQIGPRLSGSPQAANAVEATRRMLIEAGADTVYLQPCMVPFWERGAKEECYAIGNATKRKLNITALGNTVGTPSPGINAQVVEVTSMEELKALGHSVKGKIVFFNIAMNPTYIRTFEAYGTNGVGRFIGAGEASRYGALAVLVRSLASNPDDFPHTGVTRYNDSFPKIAAAAISTNDAKWLSKELRSKKVSKLFLKTNCVMHKEMVPSFNVIGELRGTEKPEEIISVGGHLDSWDLAEGAHDDGAGCVQSIEIIRAFKALGIKPKRTVRAVMFMNEENGGGGADAYFDNAKAKSEQHIFAMESDAGGFTPRGFGIDASDKVMSKIKGWTQLFLPYGVYMFEKGGGGADIGRLKKIGAALAGLMPDSQRYFDVHHASTDVFEAVSKRELELGAINMAALIWLVSEYGL